MNSTPSTPPNKPIMVTFQNGKSCQTPAMTNAGTVKMMPAATDSPAEAIVWTMLFSRIDPLRMIPRRMPIETIAAGIEADTVIPA